MRVQKQLTIEYSTCESMYNGSFQLGCEVLSIINCSCLPYWVLCAACGIFPSPVNASINIPMSSYD
jgi:hypothetical protein